MKHSPWISRCTSMSKSRCRTPFGSRCRFPAEYTDRPYFNYKFRIDNDGYVLAPTEPGLGYPIDRNALDKVTKQIMR